MTRHQGSDQLTANALRYFIGNNAFGTVYNNGNYPPHNIEKIDDDTFRLTVAVAGFSEDTLQLTTNDGILTIKGTLSDSDGDVEYLYRGIASRNFSREFKLGDHVRVSNAILKHGLLKVDLIKEIPEEKKPIPINISVK